MLGGFEAKTYSTRFGVAIPLRDAFIEQWSGNIECRATTYPDPVREPVELPVEERNPLHRDEPEAMMWYGNQ